MKKPDEHGQYLDAYEQELEDNLTFNIVSNAETQALTEKIKCGVINSLQKDQNINLRINAGDLKKIKNIAKHDGLKYQTLITSLIHQYTEKRAKDAYG